MNLLQGPEMKPEMLWEFLRYAMEFQRHRDTLLLVEGLHVLEINERKAFVLQLCRLRNLLRAAKPHSSRIMVTSRMDENLVDLLVEVPLLSERVELSGAFHDPL